MASIVIPLDLWARLGGRTNKLSTPAIYKVLARQSRGMVAEYPLAPAGSDNYANVFFQNVYEKPLLNGYLEGTSEEQRAASLVNLADPSTPGNLATLGVRYVILDTVPNGSGWPPSGKPGRGYRLIYQEPYASLYEVTARPSGPALPAVGEGFAPTEFAKTGSFNWLEHPNGTISLTGACDICDGVLSMSVESFAQPRTVEVLASDGHLLARRTVTRATPITVPLRFSKHTEIKVTTKPGPQSIHKTTGSPDPRSVSVQLGNLSFRASDA